MSYREKCIVAQIAALLLVYGYYGARLWGVPLTPVLATAALTGIIVMSILILIAAHIAIALASRPEKADERDRVVAQRGSRNGYGALMTGVWCVLLLIISHVSYELLFYSIMAAAVVAELVRLGSQLFYYRFAT